MINIHTQLLNPNLAPESTAPVWRLEQNVREAAAYCRGHVSFARSTTHNKDQAGDEQLRSWSSMYKTQGFKETLNSSVAWRLGQWNRQMHRPKTSPGRAAAHVVCSDVMAYQGVWCS